MKEKLNDIMFGFILVVSIISIFYVVYDQFLRIQIVIKIADVIQLFF